MATTKREILTNYKSKWDGDQITISKVGSSTVVEIEVSGNLKDRKGAENSSTPSQPSKMKKEARVELIRSMVKKKETRDTIKKKLYEQDIYKGNPNPASAFAGDWKAANT